nr:hypothetical protein [Tanacetum cinerariifolium]
MQTNQFAGAISSDRLCEEGQKENDEFLKTIDENMQKIIKEQVKEQVKTSYAVVADLFEMELKKILIMKMEGNKNIWRNITLKRRHDDDANKDEEPFARSNRGTSASESAAAEEPMQTTFEMEEPSHLEFETGADDQPIVKEQVKVQVSKILPKIEQTVNEQLEAKVLTRSSNSSKTSYAVVADLFEMELKKILIEKMEGNKSIHISNAQRNLYKALVKAYESDKIILDTYGDTVTLKRRRDDDVDKDKEPSTRSDKGSKRGREGKEPESASAPKEKATRSLLWIFVQEKINRDVLTIGSTMRIPLLYRGEYSQWVERLMNYLEEQMDGEAMINSIKNDKSMWPDQEKKIQKIDRLARSLLIQGLPNDIILSLIATKLQKFYGMLLLDICLVLNMKNKIRKLQFCMTMMRQTKNLMDINIDALYNILKQKQGDVNDAMGLKKKTVVVTSNLLALIAEKTEVSKRKEKVVVCSDSEGSDADDFRQFVKDCKKVKVKDYEYYKTKLLLAKKDKDEQVLLAENQAWMESSSDSDKEINANMVFMAQIEKVLSDSETSSSSADDKISEQTSSLKLYVSTVILEKIIIDLEDEVVSLLEKGKANLETIKSLKSEGFELNENAIYESENQSENDCQVVEKECDNVENSKVIAPGMFKLNVSQSVSPIYVTKMSCASNNVKSKLKRKRLKRKSSKQNDKQVNNNVSRDNSDFVHFLDLDIFSSVKRPKHSSVIWNKKGSSNTSNIDLSSVSHLKLDKDVKQYSRKDLLSCNNSHLRETSSVYVCNDAMNVSGNSRLCDLFDENNLFIFDDEVVRISLVSKMPFKKEPRDSMKEPQDEVVNLLEKEKVNLETIESLKSKGFESSENVSSELENQTENGCLVVEKEYDKEENPKVIAPGMFKLNVSQCVSPISMSKSSCDSNNVEIMLKRKRHLDTFSSFRRPKNSDVIWKKKGSSNTSNVGLSAVNVSNLNKNVKRYSRKDLLACNNSHLGETSSVYMCNDAMNVSRNSRLNDLLDDNNFCIFDDVNVRISPVSKMPFRKKPCDSMHVRSKSNMIKSLPRTVHKWLPKLQPILG